MKFNLYLKSSFYLFSFICLNSRAENKKVDIHSGQSSPSRSHFINSKLSKARASKSKDKWNDEHIAMLFSLFCEPTSITKDKKSGEVEVVDSEVIKVDFQNIIKSKILTKKNLLDLVENRLGTLKKQLEKSSSGNSDLSTRIGLLEKFKKSVKDNSSVAEDQNLIRAPILTGDLAPEAMKRQEDAIQKKRASLFKEMETASNTPDKMQELSLALYQLDNASHDFQYSSQHQAKDAVLDLKPFGLPSAIFSWVQKNISAEERPFVEPGSKGPKLEQWFNFATQEEPNSNLYRLTCDDPNSTTNLLGVSKAIWQEGEIPVNWDDNTKGRLESSAIDISEWNYKFDALKKNYAGTDKKIPLLVGGQADPSNGSVPTTLSFQELQDNFPNHKLEKLNFSDGTSVGLLRPYGYKDAMEYPYIVTEKDGILEIYHVGSISITKVADKEVHKIVTSLSQ